MGFAAISEVRNGIKFYKLQNRSTGEMAEIVPDMGGAVNRLALDIGNGAQPILYHDSDAELKQDLVANAWFRGRVLFPFNDMIPDGKYQFGEKNYQLEINIEDENFALHGFLYHKSADSIIMESVSNNAQLALTYNFNGRDMGYPFKVSIEIIYTLSENGFDILFKIENRSKIPAPIALGWHPYFKLDGKSNEWNLKLKSENVVEVDDDLVPTGNIVSSINTKYDFNEAKPISNMELDIALSAPKDGIIELSSNEKVIRMKQDTKYFKYIQMYTPEDRNSIAIEPVTAATNSFNFHNLGIISLAPNEKIKTAVSVFSSK